MRLLVRSLWLLLLLLLASSRAPLDPAVRRVDCGSAAG